MNYDHFISINQKIIALNTDAYFIVDIASNHDGELSRAKELIWLAKESGADAVKFQHFKANKIVSDFGFKQLGTQLSHQATWNKSVYDIYTQYECNREWNEEIAKTALEVGIDLMTTPYDEEAVLLMDKYVVAYKIGSGDITYTEFIELVSQKGKPVILATGASTIEDVDRAIHTITKYNSEIALLQCNTNYTGDIENFKYINLRVLLSYANKYPNMVLGLSDHTPGHATVLGAISLGARIIEKHFTDDNNRLGPDHLFSMNPQSWEEMIKRSRELQFALGDGIKKIEVNEKDTVQVQRRSLRVIRDISAGTILKEHDIESLRPAPLGSIPPYCLMDTVGRILINSKLSGDAIFDDDLEG